MADDGNTPDPGENQDGDQNDDQNQNSGGGGDSTPTPEETREKRKAAIAKLSIEAQKQALNAPNTSTNQNLNSDDLDIDLEGLEAEQAKAIKKALREAKKISEHTQTLVDFGLKAARRAKALEIAHDVDAFDEVDDFEKILQTANSPEAIELKGKEILLELKADGSFAPKKNQPATPPAQRKFDDGRGTGGNTSRALKDKIDEVVPGSKEAEAELAKMKKDVDAAQARFLKSRK